MNLHKEEVIDVYKALMGDRREEGDGGKDFPGTDHLQRDGAEVELWNDWKRRGKKAKVAPIGRHAENHGPAAND